LTEVAMFEDCLVTGAVGDALGAEVEFASWRQIQQRHGPDGIREMPAHAQFTDDTQMTLFTAEGVIRTSTRLRATGITTHVGVGHQALLRWYQTQGGPDDHASGWLITNPLLHRRRAPGNTCLSSLASGEQGSVDEPINDSKGCGAVMRMAPVGLWYAGHPEPAYATGCDLGAITHGHQEGYESAGALAAIVAGVAGGQPLATAVEVALGIAGREERTDTVLALEEAIRFADAGSVDPDELCADLGEGWVGEEALALSVACALAHPDHPLEALWMSVNHRGDSDSTGAITGNLLGLTHGSTWIPDGWLDRVDGIDLVRTVAVDLWTERHAPPTGDDGFGGPDPAWSELYPGA